MEWRKNIELPFENPLYITSIFLIIGSFYLNSLWLFLFVIFFCLINVTTSFYLKHIVDAVRLRNSRQSVRLFVNDEANFSFRLANEARLPLFNGTMTFLLDDYAISEGVEKIHSRKTQHTYELPFSLGKQEGLELSVPIKGMRRGVAKVRGIHLTLHDWFGIGTAQLDFDPVFLTELVVYPEFQAVQGLDQVWTAWQGARHTQYSLNEDNTAPTGTRDYLPSDSFNRVHWKASAKSGNLQTKVFEKTNGMTWVLLLNVSREGSTVADLEREISCLAYLCKFATEHHIPFEIYMNIKTRGVPMVHLTPGEGREQLAKALDLLSRVNINSLTLPAHRLLAYVDGQRYQNPVMILCNLGREDDPNGVLYQWKKKGYQRYFVDHRDDVSYIVDARKGKAVS